MRLIILLFAICIIAGPLNAASNRSYFCCDFVLKESGLGKVSLYKGSLSYHVKSATLLYKMSFPKEALWIFRRDSFYIVDQHRHLVLSEKLHDDGALRLFRLIITNRLNDFGISDWPYTFKRYIYAGSSIVKVYVPKMGAKKSTYGEIHLAYKEKLLSGVIFLKPSSGAVMLKTFFSDYIRSGIFLVPKSIIQEQASGSGKLFRQYKLSAVLFTNDIPKEWVSIYDLKNQKIGN
jgi:hypothetical protein